MRAEQLLSPKDTGLDYIKKVALVRLEHAIYFRWWDPRQNWNMFLLLDI
jgi:hypothetical protein